MKITDTFRENLRALLKQRGLNPTSASGAWKIPQRTIASYIGKERESVGIETVERFAEGIGLEPWQLLVRGFDPWKPPVLLPTEGEEAELIRLYRALDDDTKPALLSRARGLYLVDHPGEDLPGKQSA
jgi:hypothetical protein